MWEKYTLGHQSEVIEYADAFLDCHRAEPQTFNPGWSSVPAGFAHYKRCS